MISLLMTEVQRQDCLRLNLSPRTFTLFSSFFVTTDFDQSSLHFKNPICFIHPPQNLTRVARENRITFSRSLAPTEPAISISGQIFMRRDPEEARAHKKRQIRRRQEYRQVALDDLLDRIPPLSTSPLHVHDDIQGDQSSFSVTDVYVPIPPLPNPQEFWDKVPDACNPMTALMDSTIVADPSKFESDTYKLRRLHRKLQGKLQNGLLTNEEYEEQWNLHGRMHQTPNQPLSSLWPANQTFESPSKSHPENKVEQARQLIKQNIPIAYMSAERGQRKAWQVENFVALLGDKLKPGMTVVDFGSGSGNLCLALAAYFPKVRFVLVDKKSYSLQLAQRRAESSKLNNVQIQHFHFSPGNLESYETPPFPAGMTAYSEDENSFHLGIGLHCCGSFTDVVMELCRNHAADCIVCPCCNGNMKFKVKGGYSYPRSNFMKSCMTGEEYLLQLSSSADDHNNYKAKCWIEYDRAMWAYEQRFARVELWKMTPVECTPKHHLLYLKQSQE